MRLKADLTLLLISIIWGSAFVAQRLAAQVGSIYLFNGARYLLAGIVVLPFVGRDALRISSYSREQYKWMFVAGFVLFVGSALQQLGVAYTTAGNAGFITSLYVVLVPIVLFILWREKVHWMSIVAVALAGVGAFFLSTGGRFEIRGRCIGICRRTVLDIPCHSPREVCLEVRAHVVLGWTTARVRFAQFGSRFVRR